MANTLPVYAQDPVAAHRACLAGWDLAKRITGQGEGVEIIVRQAEESPGWVEYDIVNPTTGRVQAKMSYVMKVDDVYIGCGVYKTLA